MRLPRFGRFLSGAGGDEWIDYSQYSEEKWWEKEERTKREEDTRRGSWVVSDPLTPDEEEEWRDIKYNLDYYNVVEKTENEQTWTEYEFKDPAIKAKFLALEKKKKDHDDTNNYALCRLAPKEYYEVKDKVLKEGLGELWVKFETQSETGFKYIKVDFPQDYKLLLNNEFGRAKQAVNPAGYHITICYDKTYVLDPKAKEATDVIAEKYGEWWQKIEIKNISISSGDTYQIDGDSEFAEDLRRTVAITLAGYKDNPNYRAHISMD
jgi:hypothetical protein